MAQQDQKADDTVSSHTMKAIVCTAYGEPKDVLKVIDVPKPEPKPKELLIEIYSCALNPVDYKMVKGWLSLVLKKKFPWIPGRDFAGRVSKIGAKVNQKNLAQKGIKVGTFVCGMISHFPNDGTLCEYICITPEYCEPFPVNKLNCNQAASIPLAGMTAYQAVMGKGALPSKGKLLVLGGSSGCGVYAIQIAKAYGASEIAVTSSQEAFCKSLGADIVLNYKDKNVPIWYKKLKGQNYNVIFDCVGGLDSWDNAHQILGKNGSFVTIVGDSKHGEASSVGGLLGQGASMVNRKFWSVWGNPNYVNFLMSPTGGLDALMKAVDDGKLKPILDDSSPYTLDNFMAMFEKQMSHTAHGKLVLEFKAFDGVSDKNANEVCEDDAKDPNDEKNAAEQEIGDENKEQQSIEVEPGKVVFETQEYTYKSIEKESGKITCLDSEFNDVVFDLDLKNKELMEKIENVIAEGEEQKKDVQIVVSVLKNDGTGKQTVCDAKVSA